MTFKLNLPRNEKKYIKIIKNIYSEIEDKIKKRINDFENTWSSGNDEDIFRELCFCILTPQSKAKYCWKTILTLSEKKLLIKGSIKEIKKEMNRVRFKNKKSEYLIAARKQFTKNGEITIREIIERFSSSFEAREWLVDRVRGFGFKEASHFLRNIGRGNNFAILDRHILKNLTKLNIIDNIPTSVSKKKYLEVEEKMNRLSLDIRIPMSHLDLLFWYMEAGEVFK